MAEGIPAIIACQNIRPADTALCVISAARVWSRGLGCQFCRWAPAAQRIVSGGRRRSDEAFAQAEIKKLHIGMNSKLLFDKAMIIRDRFRA